MSCTSKPEFNSLSIVNGCLILVPAIFSSKTSYSNLSIPSKLIKLNLSCSLSSSLPSPFSLTKTTHSSSVVAFVAQTSNWTQQEDREIDKIEDSGEDGFGDAEDLYPEPPEGAKLFVANLPYDVDCEKLAYMFDQAGIVEVAEVVYDRETDKSRGFGFVTMRTVEEADKAVEMFHSYDINGRRLIVHKDVARGSRPAPVYQPNYRIYVGSLPWDVDSARLEQLFSKYGKVVGARVIYDRESNRSRGFGFVEMSTEAELNDAIANLDGQNLGGRAIKVSVAKQNLYSAKATNAVE